MTLSADLFDQEDIEAKVKEEEPTQDDSSKHQALHTRAHATPEHSSSMCRS